jgi:hypothetical protein
MQNIILYRLITTNNAIFFKSVLSNDNRSKKYNVHIKIRNVRNVQMLNIKKCIFTYSALKSRECHVSRVKSKIRTNNLNW